jgi:type III secretion protein U
VSGEKTEKPTPKKLQDSRKKGDVPYSRDFSQTMLTLAMLCFVLWDGRNIVQDLERLLLAPANLTALDYPQALRLAWNQAMDAAVEVMWPLLAIVLGFGAFVEFVQIGLVIAVEKVTPSGKKLNVVSNVQNIFSAKNLMEVLKSAVKMVCFSLLTVLLLRQGLGPLVQAVHAGMNGMLAVMAALFHVLLLYTAVFCLLIALFDMGWQRWQRHRRLMMTKQEVTREQKDMEGKPELKQTRKRLHQEMATSGAVSAVRKASALVVNPTHVAVALRYDPATTPLPIVIAKGCDGVALQMIDMARQLGVPVMRDVPLARALLADARENDYIPSELVVPVAHVLRAVRDFALEGTTVPPHSQ